MSIILFIIILFILVLVHEFGHFIVAKKFGIRVDEFGFGFPPRAAKLFTKGETTYTLNWIPFGGFVKIFGENPDTDSISGPDASRSFINKPKYAQALVLVAGVFFNLLLAWLLFSVGFISGMPSSSAGAPEGAMLHNERLTLVAIKPESPAETAGFKPGDVILSVSDEKGSVVESPTVEELIVYIGDHAEKPITVSYERGGDTESVSVTPELGIVGDDKGGIGISPDMIGTLKLPFFKSIYEGAKLTIGATKATVVGFGNLIKNSVTGNADFSSISGPVGLVGIVGDAYKFGLSYLISFVAIISINLAVINLIPFPALDGGRLLFLLIETIKGSRLSPKFANIANAIGFFILIGLMIAVTWHDVAKLL